MSQIKRQVESQMNCPKALCLLGLRIAASVETSLGSDPKETLNKAIFGQMQAVMHKKMESMIEMVIIIIIIVADVLEMRTVSFIQKELPKKSFHQIFC